MKDFLKTALASAVGVLLSGTLLFLLLIALIAGTAWHSEAPFDLQDNSVLKLSVGGTLREQSQKSPFDFSIPGLPVRTETEEQGLDDILSAISKAKNNPKIEGIYLEAKSFRAGLAGIGEIRNALKDFQKSGKYVYAYGDLYDQSEYYLCSVANRVFINPEGAVNFHGLTAHPIFFKGTLDKLGIKAEVFRVGAFKSAVEPFVNTKMSEESRLQTQEYLDGIWNHLLIGISESRRIPIDRLNTLANRNMLGEPVEELVKNKLVDSVVYESEMKQFLAKKQKVKDVRDLRMVSVSNFLSTDEQDNTHEKDQLAVLYAEGELFDESTDGINRDDLIAEINKIKTDKAIKAVVFRINSPGGSAFASEQIWKAVADLKAIKPVVVSMGDYAASGGYYIACNANKIITAPNTLTGSIGIYGLFFSAEKLAEKVGLSFDVVKTNDLSNFGDISRSMTEPEKSRVQKYVERGYHLFLKRCAEGRKMNINDLKKIADGRIYTGTKAVELGLADEIGGIDRAIRVAAELGKTNQYRVVCFPEKKDFLTRLFDEWNCQAKTNLALRVLGKEYAPLFEWKEKNIQTGILARMNAMDIR